MAYKGFPMYLHCGACLDNGVRGRYDMRYNSTTEIEMVCTNHREALRVAVFTLAAPVPIAGCAGCEGEHDHRL